MDDQIEATDPKGPPLLGGGGDSLSKNSNRKSYERLSEEIRARVTFEQYEEAAAEVAEYHRRNDRSVRPADWVEPSITLAEAEAFTVFEYSDLAAEMRRRGVDRMTRSEYFSWKFIFGVPHDWDCELESQIPDELQDAYMTIDPKLRRRKGDNGDW